MSTKLESMVGFKRENLWQAARTLLAFGLAWGGGRLAGLQEIYWALITAVIVIQPGLQETLAIGRDRILGTILGAAAGFLILESEGHGLPLAPLFLAALVILTFISSLWPNMRIACITLIVVILVPSTGSEFDRPLDRVAEILIGTIASIIASAAIQFGHLNRKPR